MNRLKFRAWSVKEKYMFYASSLSGVGDFFIARKEDYGDYEELYNNFCDVDYKWMQATSCTDKNGKDIFEGDILKDDTNIAIVKFGKYKANNNKLYNNEEAYGFYLDYLSHKDVIDHATNIGYWEVIGNIYKNPELL